jgi:hypothetical protein
MHRAQPWHLVECEWKQAEQGGSVRASNRPRRSRPAKTHDFPFDCWGPSHGRTSKRMTFARGGRRRARSGGSPRGTDPSSGLRAQLGPRWAGLARLARRARRWCGRFWIRPGSLAGAGRSRGTCSVAQGVAAQAKSSCSRERAGVGRGGSVGLPRWARILRTTTGSVSCAMRWRGPPRCGRVRASTAKTRRRSSAQVERRESEQQEVLGARSMSWERERRDTER